MTTPPHIDFQTETAAHAPQINALLDTAFGPGRFAKTAERLREGNASIADLCVAAYVDGVMRASVRYWPITIGDTDALLLGPLAVDPTCRGQGIGIALMQHTLAKAKALGHAYVLLVGDEPYYARVGFAKAAQGSIHLPGPVDADRILLLSLQGKDFARLKGDVSVPRDTTRAANPQAAG